MVIPGRSHVTIGLQETVTKLWRGMGRFPQNDTGRGWPLQAILRANKEINVIDSGVCVCERLSRVMLMFRLRNLNVHVYSDEMR